MPLPLEGLRIIDLTIVWAGPFGTMQLADLGAEVIIVESLNYLYAGRRAAMPYPSDEYLTRTKSYYGYPDRQGGLKSFDRYFVYNWYGRKKKSMTVDLTHPEGKEIIKRLVKVSDGLVENQAARNMENLGLGYEVLKEVNPQLIMIRMPGFGITGPYKYRLGYGYTMDAIAGHTSLRHYPDADPITTSVFHGDACGGGILATMFLMALHYRNRTGKGQLIDISQTENAISTFGQAFLDYFMNGRVQRTLGNRDAHMAPQGVYPCQSKQGLETGSEDTWWVLSVENDEQWQALCRVMGRPELADDPRFADVVSRKRNEALIDPILIDWAKDKDQYQIMHLLQAEGIPAGPVIDQPDIRRDPHVQARGHLVPVTHPATGPYVDGKPTPGTHLHTAPIPKLSKTPLPIRTPAPTLGQHNDYVYKELLGYSDEEYQRFIEEKHVGGDYLPTAR